MEGCQDVKPILMPCMLHTGAYRSPFGGQKLVGSAPAGCTAESLLRVAPRSKFTAGSPGIPAGQAGWRLEPRGRKEASGARRPKSEGKTEGRIDAWRKPRKGQPCPGGNRGNGHGQGEVEEQSPRTFGKGPSERRGKGCRAPGCTSHPGEAAPKRRAAPP